MLLIRESTNMSTQMIFELTLGLLSSDVAKSTEKPYCIVLPTGTDVHQMYFELDGRANGNLKDKLLSIPDIEEVRVGQGMGLSLVSAYSKTS